ncbi:MAG: hypothetical protein PHE61_08440, partial [Candidatus Omnitrophica bacterium]|nr:hypothetical protein [Candidatus Omnitrophota bacterium]
ARLEKKATAAVIQPEVKTPPASVMAARNKRLAVELSLLVAAIAGASWFLGFIGLFGVITAFFLALAVFYPLWTNKPSQLPLTLSIVACGSIITKAAMFLIGLVKGSGIALVLGTNPLAIALIALVAVVSLGLSMSWNDHIKKIQAENEKIMRDLSTAQAGYKTFFGRLIAGFAFNQVLNIANSFPLIFAGTTIVAIAALGTLALVGLHFTAMPVVLLGGVAALSIISLISRFATIRIYRDALRDGVAPEVTPFQRGRQAAAEMLVSASSVLALLQLTGTGLLLALPIVGLLLAVRFGRNIADSIGGKLTETIKNKKAILAGSIIAIPLFFGVAVALAILAYVFGLSFVPAGAGLMMKIWGATGLVSSLLFAISGFVNIVGQWKLVKSAIKSEALAGNKVERSSFIVDFVYRHNILRSMAAIQAVVGVIAFGLSIWGTGFAGTFAVLGVLVGGMAAVALPIVIIYALTRVLKNVMDNVAYKASIRHLGDEGKELASLVTEMTKRFDGFSSKDKTYGTAINLISGAVIVDGINEYTFAQLISQILASANSSRASPKGGRYTEAQVKYMIQDALSIVNPPADKHRYYEAAILKLFRNLNLVSTPLSRLLYDAKEGKNWVALSQFFTSASMAIPCAVTTTYMHQEAREQTETLQRLGLIRGVKFEMPEVCLSGLTEAGQEIANIFDKIWKEQEAKKPVAPAKVEETATAKIEAEKARAEAAKVAAEKAKAEAEAKAKQDAERVRLAEETKKVEAAKLAEAKAKAEKAKAEAEAKAKKEEVLSEIDWAKFRNEAKGIIDSAKTQEDIVNGVRDILCSELQKLGVKDIEPKLAELVKDLTVTLNPLISEDHGKLTPAQEAKRKDIVRENSFALVEGCLVDPTTGSVYDRGYVKADGRVEGLGEYTSPTNEGLHLLYLADIAKGHIQNATLTKDRKPATEADVLNAILKKLKTYVSLPQDQKWNGLYYWYEIRNGKLIKAKDHLGCLIISQPDNANFFNSVGCVIGAFIQDVKDHEAGKRKDAYYDTKKSIVETAQRIIGQADWSKLFDAGKKQFYLAVDTNTGKPIANDKNGKIEFVNNIFDEWRLGVVWALAHNGLKGQATHGIPENAWQMLDRNFVEYKAQDGTTIQMLASGHGGEFQRKLPRLFIPEDELSPNFLAQVHRNSSDTMEDYAARNGLPYYLSAATVPAGVYSEEELDAAQKAGVYHQVDYDEFGLPFAALKQDEEKYGHDKVAFDAVSTPHAVAFGFIDDPSRVINRFFLAEKSISEPKGPAGYWDSISKDGKKSYVTLSLDQFFLILSLQGRIHQDYLMNYLRSIGRDGYLKQLYGQDVYILKGHAKKIALKEGEKKSVLDSIERVVRNIVSGTPSGIEER